MLKTKNILKDEKGFKEKNLGTVLKWNNEVDIETGKMKRIYAVVNFDTVYTIEKTESGFVMKKTKFMGGVDKLNLAKEFCQKDYNNNLK